MCMDFKTTQENINIYPFIAYVKITTKQVKNDTTYSGDTMRVKYAHDGILSIDILELFKGNPVKTIREYDILTSCEIGIFSGEEWVLFASYDSLKKEYTIGACSPSRQVKNRKGERNWEYYKGMNPALRVLREHFKHPFPEDKYDNGQFKGYFSNGNLEWVGEYKNHQLHGPRKVYYSDGKIYIEENYVGDKLDGFYRVYNNAGQLVKESFYDKGRSLYSKKWNDYTVDPDGGHFIKTAEYKGRPATAWLRRESFSPDTTYRIDCDYYKNGLLEEEAIYYWSKYCVITRYHKNGKINSRLTRYWYEKKESYQEWDKDGKLKIDKVQPYTQPNY